MAFLRGPVTGFKSFDEKFFTVWIGGQGPIVPANWSYTGRSVVSWVFRVRRSQRRSCYVTIYTSRSSGKNLQGVKTTCSNVLPQTFVRTFQTQHELWKKIFTWIFTSTP